MILRLRSRDGMERVEVSDTATVGDLRIAIQAKLDVPVEKQTLSVNQALLMSKNPAAFTDMTDAKATLKKLNIAHGAMVYLKYDFERTVEPVAKINTVPFGAKMTMEDMLATQTRIEPQEKAHCVSCSFDANAANIFQAYVHGTLQFAVERVGFMFGTVDEGAVKVEFIYEPPQEATATSTMLMRDAQEEKAVGFIAAQLGFQQVGVVITHSDNDDREYHISGKQVAMVAEMAKECAELHGEHGEHFVVAIVSLDETEDEEKFVNIEAFALSDQIVKLCKEGWFAEEQETENVEKMGLLHTNKDVIVAGKDTQEVDTDFLIIAVPILDHQGMLECKFPVENRLITSTSDDLKACLRANGSKAYCERLSDFHLLLFLSRQLDLTTDIALLLDAVLNKTAVSEGYQLIIDSIAGIM